MIYKVDFSAQAATDLSEIIKYICEELHSPQAAGRFYNEVNEKRELLCAHPYMFPLYHDKELSLMGVHSVVIGNF